MEGHRLFEREIISFAGMIQIARIHPIYVFPMSSAILAEELDGQLGQQRADAAPIPAKADWAALLRTMPKQA